MRKVDVYKRAAPEDGEESATEPLDQYWMYPDAAKIS
jgi:hypothetical protein